MLINYNKQVIAAHEMKAGERRLTTKRQHTAISLFSGAGGLDVGFERAGFKTLFANELDKDAAATWRANRPGSDAMHQGDVNDFLSCLTAYKGVDVLFGGPPCQGFSVAGKMDPEDPRSQLIWSFLDAVEIAKPESFIIENVRALGVLQKWKSVRDEIVNRSEKLGYKCGFRVYSASDYGVPQRRERVVFVGLKGIDRDINRFFDAMSTMTKHAPSLREVLLGVGRYGSTDNPQTCTSHVSLAKNPVMRKSPYAGMLVNGAGRPMNLDGVAHTLPASMGGNKTPIIDQIALETGEENWFVGYHDRLVNGKSDPCTETIPNNIRRLTIKEAAALQTFPSDYVFCGEKTQQYKQIGNAVASDFAEAIAKSLIRCLG